MAGTLAGYNAKLQAGMKVIQQDIATVLAWHQEMEKSIDFEGFLLEQITKRYVATNTPGKTMISQLAKTDLKTAEFVKGLNRCATEIIVYKNRCKESTPKIRKDFDQICAIQKQINAYLRGKAQAAAQAKDAAKIAKYRNVFAQAVEADQVLVALGAQVHALAAIPLPG